MPGPVKFSPGRPEFLSLKGGRTRLVDIEISERFSDHLLKLHRAGATYEEISDVHDMTPRAAWGRVQKAMARERANSREPLSCALCGEPCLWGSGGKLCRRCLGD